MSNEITTLPQNEIAKRNVPTELIQTSNTNFEIIEKIKKLTLITPDEISKFHMASDFALSSFRDTPAYRPMAVKVVSVLNDGNFPTPDAKFWQCSCEAEVHFNELTRDYYKYQRSVVDLEEIDYKIDEMRKALNNEVVPNEKIDPNLLRFDKKRMEIKREQIEFELKLLEKEIKYRIQEVTDWNEISKELKGQCKYSTENYQDHKMQSLITSITFRLRDPKIKEEDKKSLQKQLDTFIRLNKGS